MTALALTLQPATNKYVAVALIALRQRTQARAALPMRAVFFALILVIFSRLWEAIVPNPGDYVWYLAVADWVTLMQPRLFDSIQRDVRSGDVTCMLGRPISYLGTKLAEACGELIPAFIVLALVGCGLAYLLSGGLPREPVGLLAALVLGLLGSVLWQLISAWIGLCAFWLDDCTPLAWLWQKAAFVLGGMFVPLTLYPEWLRTVAAWLPFSAMIGGPASMVLHFDLTLCGLLAAKLVASIVLAWHGLRFTYGRALRVIELGGG
jgi:ABC-2 type transport system permease protein